jgi:hypothetical protein
MAVVVAPSRGTPSRFVAEYTLWIGDPGKSANGDNSGAAVADAASRLLLADADVRPGRTEDPDWTMQHRDLNHVRGH